jgi:hypothetical protein
MIRTSSASGIQHAGMLEVAGDTGGPMEQNAHPPLDLGPQLVFTVGQTLLVDTALEVRASRPLLV